MHYEDEVQLLRICRGIFPTKAWKKVRSLQKGEIYPHKGGEIRRKREGALAPSSRVGLITYSGGEKCTTWGAIKIPCVIGLPARPYGLPVRDKGPGLPVAKHGQIPPLFMAEYK